MKITITGDRSAPPGACVAIVQQILLGLYAKGINDITLVVGLDKGVESAVRFVAGAAGIPLIDLQFLTNDWEAYGLLLKENARAVFFVHSDPSSSSLYPGISGAFDDLDFELVNPELLFSPV